ncbi:hypothetical protein Clacol_003586 [Clathrus columnatus]|uniref:Actin-like ATPase domain-containing protein n=1 Tax=Clathrus columnatus TaxID=1419009 RepID=A0AAV5A7Y8_9AGAM|nr:hypothetical protein Clacol_003586 [Clathrus columnatus]
MRLLAGLLLISVTQFALASILAIDYGTEWMKVSLVKPGSPFDVLLNRDSKRKIQSSVGWKNNDRLFGSDAFNIATRFPKDSFSSLKYLQGQTTDTDTISFFTSIANADIVETTRKTVSLRRSDGTEWSVEELIAMQFAYVKELAESTANEKVVDVVVAIPPYYSQFERQAVLDAIEISGLKSLGIINDGTAVAVNYAMTRTFPTPETHLIYDAGAGSIRATIATFSTTPASDNGETSKSKKKDSTSVEIKAIGYSRQIGGDELDRRLREILIDKFNSKSQKNIRTDSRGMAKLWKEAGRVKGVLSANAEAVARVENLAFDIDFRSSVSREEFENVLTDLKPAFSQPILDALENAKLSLDNITSVILMGGSSRVPIIQQAVRDTVGDGKVAQNVNADEAVVLGTAFYGASISSQFKTKDIKVQDVIPYDIQVSYLAEAKAADASSRTLTSVLFPAHSKYGSKKILTIKRKNDFDITLSYKSPQPGVFPSHISQARLLNVSEAIANLTEQGAIDPVIKVTLALTESGFVIIQDAVAFGEVKEESIAAKLKGFFGGSSADSTTLDTSETPSVDPSSAAPTGKPNKRGNNEGTIQLEFDLTPLSIHPLTYAEKKLSHERLLTIQRSERSKQQREEQRNLLESYLYRLRDLTGGGEDAPFIIFSKATERDEISHLLDKTSDWLNENGETADLLDLWSKREALEALEKPIQTRHMESEILLPSIQDLEQALQAGQVFLESARQNYTMEEASGVLHKYTWEEIEDVETRLKSTASWLEEKVKAQKALPLNEDPVLLSSDVISRGKAFQNHVMRLLKRKIPKAKPTSTGTDSTANSTTLPVAEETTTIQDSSTHGHDEL